MKYFCTKVDFTHSEVQSNVMVMLMLMMKQDDDDVGWGCIDASSTCIHDDDDVGCGCIDALMHQHAFVIMMMMMLMLILVRLESHHATCVFDDNVNDVG